MQWCMGSALLELLNADQFLMSHFMWFSSHSSRSLIWQTLILNCIMDSIVSFFIIVLLEIEPYIESFFSRCSSFIVLCLKMCIQGFVSKFYETFQEIKLQMFNLLSVCFRGVLQIKNVFNQFSPTYISSVVFFLFSNLKYKSTLRGIFTITEQEGSVKKYLVLLNAVT